MSMAENQVYYHKQVTASAVIKPGAGVLGDIFVSSASGASITICDDADTGGEHIIAGPFTPAAATAYPFHSLMERGIAIIITGTCTVSVRYT